MGDEQEPDIDERFSLPEDTDPDEVLRRLAQEPESVRETAELLGKVLRVPKDEARGNG